MNKVFKKIIAEFDKRINANTQLKTRAELGDKMCGYAYAKSIEAYKEGRMIVKQMAKEFNNDWILCSDRLPEEPERLPAEDELIEEMILDGEFKEYIATIYGAEEAITLYYVGNGYWYDGIGSEYYKVIAWQPLPVAYKE